MVVETMKKVNMNMAVERTGKMIEQCLQNIKLRLETNIFVRKRKLGAKRMLGIILSRIYKALQLELDDYYDELGENPVSRQAFSKARQLLNPECVREFYDMTAKIGAEDDTLACYRGMRLIAIDGSDIALENTPELKEKFGGSGPNKDAATALCSIAYGPLDHVIYDCRLDQYAKDERDLAKLHVDRLLELGLGGSLLLFDRWYPSAEFIAFLYQRGFHFVMRVRRKWNLEADAVKTQDKIILTHDGLEYTIRVLKVTLPTGEVETLVTSLNQKQLPIRKAANLYWRRWAVETSCDLIKSKLQLENFSGKTKVSVLQDFYATMYLANLVAFSAGVADDMITENDRNKELKYPRQANRNRTIDKLRKNFIRLLLEPDPILRSLLLDRLYASAASKPLSIVSDRSPPRKLPRKKRFFMSKKSVV
jgi:hypothetical protein